MAAKGGGRIPSLDGLRAVSIAMVLLAHLAGTRGFLGGTSVLWRFAELGVRVFFVISGFLITTLLFEDLQKIEAGSLSPGKALKQFYIRRAYRIFPAAYAFVLTVAALSAVGIIHLLPGDLVAAATFTTNFHQPRAWWIGHLWSLSVEEQFYLLWPTVVIVAGRRKALWFAVAALPLAPAIRVLTWIAWPGLRDYIGEAFPTIFDAIGVGCVLAGIRSWLGSAKAYLSFVSSFAFALIPLPILAAAMLSLHPGFDMALGQSVQNVAIAILIDGSIRRADSGWGRFLNSSPLVMIGKLSYSIYLWQQLFINRHSDAWSARFPINVGLALVTAFTCYQFIEQPFLRLRARRANGSLASTYRFPRQQRH